MWLSHPNFKDKIDAWWQRIQTSGSQCFRFMKKLQDIKGKLKSWNKEVFRNSEEVKNKLSLELEVLDRVEESQNLDTLECEQRWKLKLEYEQIIRMRESNGDKNQESDGLRRWMEIQSSSIK